MGSKPFLTGTLVYFVAWHVTKIIQHFEQSHNICPTKKPGSILLRQTIFGDSQ
jgi:hypothetical protein